MKAEGDPLLLLKSLSLKDIFFVYNFKMNLTY